MDTNSNKYIILYATILVVVVTVMLVFTSGLLQERQYANMRMDKMRQILLSLNIEVPRGENVEDVYNQFIKKDMIVNSAGEIIAETGGFEINTRLEGRRYKGDRQLPVFIAEVDDETIYILSINGSGMWGPLWGYVALKSDRNTIYGVFFSHASETPGLGAEIVDAKFQNKFIGLTILNDEGEFVSVVINRPGQPALPGQDRVDAITGGTITTNGVSDMLRDGLKKYVAFFTNN